MKRIVGEKSRSRPTSSPTVTKIAAEVLYRPATELEWRRAPMAFFDNDRWRGSFALQRNARYQFTIEAWRDDWATWLGELAKKRGAGLDVRLETCDGTFRIAEKAGAGTCAVSKVNVD